MAPAAGWAAAVALGVAGEGGAAAGGGAMSAAVAGMALGGGGGVLSVLSVGGAT